MLKVGTDGAGERFYLKEKKCIGGDGLPGLNKASTTVYVNVGFELTKPATEPKSDNASHGFAQVRAVCGSNAKNKGEEGVYAEIDLRGMNSDLAFMQWKARQRAMQGQGDEVPACPPRRPETQPPTIPPNHVESNTYEIPNSRLPFRPANVMYGPSDNVTMKKGPFSSIFKTEVALALIKRQNEVDEVEWQNEVNRVAAKFGVTPTMAEGWKAKFLERSGLVYADSNAVPEVKSSTLQRKSSVRMAFVKLMRRSRSRSTERT